MRTLWYWITWSIIAVFTGAWAAVAWARPQWIRRYFEWRNQLTQNWFGYRDAENQFLTSRLMTWVLRISFSVLFVAALYFGFVLGLLR